MLRTRTKAPLVLSGEERGEQLFLKHFSDSVGLLLFEFRCRQVELPGAASQFQVNEMHVFAVVLV